MQVKLPYFGTTPKVKLIVERGTKDGGDKMREVGSTFVELKVADDTVVGEIFRYTRFGNSKMFGQARLDRIGAPAIGAAAQETSDGDAQGLACFDVIVSGEVGIAEEEHAGTDGSAVSFGKGQWRAAEQATELHF